MKKMGREVAPCKSEGHSCIMPMMTTAPLLRFGASRICGVHCCLHWRLWTIITRRVAEMGYGRGGGRKQQEYDNNMHGALFDGDPQKDTDPDMRGQCEVDGVEYWVAAWWKKSKRVGDFLSFALTPKDEQSNQRNDRRGPPPRGPSSEPRGRG